MMKRHKWPIGEQAGFLRKIGELLNRGYPIAEAIESLSYQLHPQRKVELSQCLIDLRSGHAFYEILSSLGFHDDLIGFVYFAEQHGSFAQALLEGSSLAMKKEKDKHKLYKLMQYPFILIIITGFLFLFIEKALLPKFTSLFTSMNLEENFFTKVIMLFGNYFPKSIFIISIALISTAFYYFVIFKKISILKQKAQIVQIPVFGHILKLLYTHYFSIQLSFLLSGGISFTEALLLFESNPGQPFYRELAKELKIRLVSGEKLESIFSSFSFFEKELTLIVKHGQENGKLEQELLFYSQYCINLVEEVIEKVLKTVQPLIYLFIGFLIVSMYLAILLPMFHLMDGI